MRKTLVAGALCAASVGAMAQTSGTASFELLSGGTNLVGVGTITYNLPTTVGSVGVVVVRNALNGPGYFSGTGHFTNGFPIGFMDVIYSVTFTNGQVTGYNGGIDTDIGVFHETFSALGTSFYQNDYPAFGGPVPPGFIQYTDSGTIAFATSVPEPETYALLLGGFVLMAAVRRHRVNPSGGSWNPTGTGPQT